MSRRRGLGRGLDALIPGGAETPDGQVAQLNIDSIERNPRQPRQRFEGSDMEELAQSIREHGVLQPIIVATPESGDQYLLIAGERRLLAARQAGLSSIPAVVRQATEQQLIVWALIENLQREDLNPLEAAAGYQQLAEEFELSHADIAEMLGKSRSAISNTLRLLNLSQSVRDALSSGQISEGHARALLAIASASGQAAALETLLSKGLNVRQTEALVSELAGKREKAKATRQRSPEEKSLEQELQTSLGTKVSLRQRGEGGTITLYYYSEEELDELVKRLTK
jgi:ParB family chromosome partitioning protein